MRVQEITEYIEQHVDIISAMVNERFEETKPFVRAKLRKIIRSYLNPLPMHYEWVLDDCPYDHSGSLVVKGYIDINQTVASFLENEYTGSWTPTYESGCGKTYDTFGDNLFYEIISIAGTIMNDTIKKFIRESFSLYALADDEMDDILDMVGDCVYDECIASDLFWYCEAIEYYNLSEVILTEI